MKRIAMRTFVVVLLFLGVASVSPAYYHFVHYLSTFPPFVPVFEKFDLDLLVDDTLRYYISSTGPEQLAPNDSLASIISEVNLAARTWSKVPTSRLRLAFGGIADPLTPQAAPGVDILFDEIPPGLVAMGGPTVAVGTVVRGDETFVPISRAVVVLNKDLSSQPSSSDAFFMTLVHEMGHALGLQHTFTSSVMSTSITRATTKSKPLGADDAAAISLLYPAPGFRESTGVIRGQVVMDGVGVTLASVVAISPEGRAISTLTHPDGTYEIQGATAGQYYVYVHPLPPPAYGEVSRANIRMPRDPEENPIIPEVYFETQFYPGVKRPDAASALALSRGQSLEGIDFFVTRREVPTIHSVTTYSFPGNLAVSSGHVSLDTTRKFLVAYGFGLSTGEAPLPGLRASVIGGSAFIPDEGVTAYGPDPRFVQINFEFNPFSGAGSRHLLFSLDDDIYVLPSGLQLSQNAPPTIQAVGATVDPSGAEAVAVVGERISERSTILFDGAPAELLGVLGPGQLLVKPPQAPGGHRATVVALNPDGQTSWFLDGLAPPVYDYPFRAEPARFSVSPSFLKAGTEAMVEIRGSGTGFGPNTALGFGSSDVVVRDYLVLDPTYILANVAVNGNASEGTVSMSAASGIELVHQPLVFGIQSNDSLEPSMHSPAYDAASGRSGAFVGKSALLRVSSLPPDVGPADVQLTLNRVPAEVELVDSGFVRFIVPPSLSPVPVVARLNVLGVEARPLLLRLALAPPRLLSAHTALGLPVSAENPVRPGELVQLRVTDLAPAEELIGAERITVEVNGISHSPSAVIPAADAPEIRIVQFVLGTAIPLGDQVPVRVLFDGRPSETLTLTIVP